ncbi:hypothetical protein [Pseudomonas guariconensis]|uniref:hypothetical protein n=1 Tax=Pseudomonas guariconensis TaxID=1288410 RepID=UPI0018AA98D7|nr:hypothetical protein [Pseudomonas guariconensis]MBF8723103.1 hypothetical protein [Pseudomonas guariconensis]MBF8793396.1 hypothetical protein [Pseudomonas monteilii]
MKKNTGSTPAQRTSGEVERDNDALRPNARRPQVGKTTAQRTAEQEGDVARGNEGTR